MGKGRGGGGGLPSFVAMHDGVPCAGCQRVDMNITPTPFRTHDKPSVGCGAL